MLQFVSNPLRYLYQALSANSSIVVPFQSKLAYRMDFSSRIPLIDQTARREAEPPPLSFRGLQLDDDIRKLNEELDLSVARSLLHQYARDGSLENLREVLRKFPMLINSGDDDELTALHYAARYGRVQVVEELIRLGANGNVLSYEDMTPLHMTAKYCKAETTMASSREEKHEKFVSNPARSLPTIGDDVEKSPVKQIIYMLIKANVLTDPLTKYGMTPLHYAAMKDNLPAAEALVEMGARVNPDPADPLYAKLVPPLITACTYGSDSVAQFLLSKGADLALVRASDGSTPFHIAALHGKDQTLTSLMHRAGTRMKQFLHQTNSEGNTPFCLAVEGGNAQTAKLILDHLGQISYTGKEQWLLHTAAAKGNLDVVKLLVEAKANPRKIDSNRRLPLHLAAKNNHKEVVEYLVGLDRETLQAVDEWGLTPLLLAASYKEAVDAVQAMVERCGADVGKRDHDGRTVIYIAAKYNSFKTLEYLLGYLAEAEKEKRKTYRSLRILEGGQSLVQSPLEYIVNQPDHNQNTPMHIVCNNGYLETCTLLKNSGAAVDKLNEDEETPLHMAARNGRNETVRWLLEQDKNLVSMKDEMGNTPLHLAAKYGHDVAAKALLDAGSDKDSRNEKNETPLFMAVSWGKRDVVQLLVQKNANLEVETESGTVIHEAASKGHDEIVRYLLQLRDGENKPKLDVTKRHNGKTALEIAIDANERDVARAFVECPEWEQLMTSQETIPLTGNNEPRSSPMRTLLRNHPDVALAVFNNCVEANHVDGIEYNFSMLDDTYMMPDEKGLVLAADIYPYCEDMETPEGGKLLPGAKTFSDDPDIIYPNHPLKIIAESERMSLLSHPLVLTLIKYKWNSLGRYVYYSALAFYLFFIVLFTFYVITTPAPHNFYNENTGKIEDLSARLSHFNATCEDISVAKRPFTQVVKAVIIVLAVVQMLKEFFQMAHRRWAYFNFDNFIEWFIYISAVLTVIDFSECSSSSGLRMTWQWIMAALCVFSCWVNLLLMVRKLPRFGIYVVMFFEVFRTFLRFSLIFGLFILAFSIAFFVLLQNRSEFSTLSSSILKTTVMMIGEFEFTAIFHGNIEEHTEKLFGHGLAYPIFFGFCIVMTILLMNLLVGLAVGDIMQIQEMAELKRLSMQVDLVLQIEATMPWIRRRTLRGRYRVYTLQIKGRIRRLFRYWTKKFGFESPIEEPVQQGHRTEEEERMYELQTEQRAQGAQIQNLQSNVDVLYEKQCHVESLLRALLDHHNIKIASDEN